MEEEEVGRIVPEDAGTGVDFNAMMRRMARESIAGAGPSINIDVETLRATAATLAQKAMAILSDESAKGRPIGSVNDIAATIVRRLYQSLNTPEESITASTPEKITQRPPEKLISDSLEEYKSLGTPYGGERQKLIARFTQAGLPTSAAAVIADRGLVDKDELAHLFGNLQRESAFGRFMFEGSNASNPDSFSKSKFQEHRYSKQGDKFVRDPNGKYSAPGIGWVQITGVKEWEMTADHLKRQGMLPSGFDSSMVAKIGTPERDRFISIVTDREHPGSMEAAVGYWEGSTWGPNNGPQSAYRRSRENPSNTFTSRSEAVIGKINSGLLKRDEQWKIDELAARRRDSAEWGKKLEEVGFE